MISRRTLLASTLALGMTSAISSNLATAQESRVLEVVSPREITSLEPHDTGYHFRRLRVAETLVTIDPTGNLAPQLAESWSVSDDGLTWTFAIRQDVHFHDGSLLTPELVRDSLDAQHKGRVNSEMVAQLPITAITVDGQSVIIELSKPFSLVPSFLTDGPAIILAPNSYAEDGSVKELIGTGPYRISQITGSTSVDLEAFADYWGEPANIEKVHYTGATSADTIANMAEAGQADLVLGLPQVLRDRVEGSGNARVKQVQTARILGPFFDSNNVRFDDAAEREAISLALDRQGIASALFQNPKAAANQFFSPAFPDWHVPDLPPITRDVEKAKKLLADAGWTPGPDGILMQGETRFSGKVIVGKQPELTTLAQAIQAQLGEVGIELILENGGQAQILESADNGTFMFGFTRRNYGAVPDPVATLLIDYAEANVGKSIWGGINYSSPELESAMTAYLAAKNETELADNRAKILKIVNSGDLPAIPVVWYDYNVSISTRLDFDSVPVDAFELSFWIDQVKWAD